MIDISKKIKDLRLEKGLKQKDVASAINIATNTLSQFENNKGRPSLEVLSLLADFFEVSVDYLIGREDDFGNIVVSSQSTDQNLSLNEKEMLESFKHLSLFEQDSILVQVKALAEKYKVKK
ncbi:MAG: helix-turn-helix transcriptional regulator [Clostridia bacterium]|nr:helix-turn-helix transcriptional regulator [Clostridia bacterium]